MEFNEKLQKLRASQNLTQEELAEKLFVSRTAVSKWESGRGYPSIDSLKVIAKFFHVSIDELICQEEMLSLAEEDKKESGRRTTVLICGILDCLLALLFFLPVFGEAGTENVTSVNVFSLTDVSGWIKALYIIIIGITVLNGFFTVVLLSFDKPQWNKHRVITGMGLLVLGTVLFIVTRQPYAGVMCLSILVLKGFLLFKSK